MRRLVSWCVAAALLGLLVLAAGTRADEEKVPLDKVPRPVIDAVKAKFPAGKIVGASTEKEEGSLVYEVTLKQKGRNIDVTVKPDGTIVCVEKEIKVKELPGAVRAALKSKYAGATYKMVEEVTRDKKVSYEVLLVTADKKTLEVVFDARGKVLKVEKKEKKESKEKESKKKGD
jgi:uncharacterized membrane protein YkoI